MFVNASHLVDEELTAYVRSHEPFALPDAKIPLPIGHLTLTKQSLRNFQLNQLDLNIVSGKGIEIKA